ncbi:MAG: DUF4091 domain-containing protein [Verrucomicrobia bacterium]|nr:DUF4091 domain-containing protein [Verrucomicrobiota bacterium]MBU4291751.1 DUF4091 domain-containing protein [Verrucomicrobiota bacterium]MBU4428606.1 DUF4091 domain-containing protein [Verrucomicrobiota bacterium]MCG2679341.1 DUF4091 domain-containing protein [Kiritimatiellia bacterium]
MSEIGKASGPFLWAVDSLVKVFRNQPAPAEAGRIVLDAARGESVSAQIVVTAGRKSLRGLAIRLESGRRGTGSELPIHDIRYVGYIPIKKNSWRLQQVELLRQAPCEIPDVLFEQPPDEIPLGENQPVYVTIQVAPDAAVGVWHGRLIVTADAAYEAEIPIALHVYGVNLPNERTAISGSLFQNGMGALTPEEEALFRQSPDVADVPKSADSEDGQRRSFLERQFGIRTFSDEYWELMTAFAREMGTHRQNGITISPLALTEKSVHDGRLVFDFSRFDRFVEIFKHAGGCDEMNFCSLATRDELRHAHFNAPYLVGRICEAKDGKVSFGEARPEHPRFEHFLSRWLPALERHLEEKGWLDSSAQHLCTEPSHLHAEQYQVLRKLCRKYAPKLRQVDAYFYWHDPQCEVNYWLPHTDYYASHLEFFRGRKAAGDRVGIYADGTTGGAAEEAVGIYRDERVGGAVFQHYLDLSLMKMRVIFWYCFVERLRGWYYWAWNEWENDPFRSCPRDYVSPGAGWLVYPSQRPALGVYSSVRAEQLLESIQDCELLRVLENRNPSKAREIAVKVMRSAHDYERDIGAFRAAKRQLLENLASERK